MNIILILFFTTSFTWAFLPIAPFNFYCMRPDGNLNVRLAHLTPHTNTPLAIEKPWGKEEIIEHNDKYVVKKIHMNKGHSCSTQYHKYKQETIVVFSGEINVYIGLETSSKIMRKLVPGDFITIRPNIVHKIEALSDCIFLETSTNELWDVIRLQDNYNRTSEVSSARGDSTRFT